MHGFATLERMTDTPWARYVRRISGGAGGSEIEKRTGIRQSNISRWLNDGTTPQPAQAAKFAQSYGANVLEAFVAAGFLSEEEAGIPPRPEVDFYTLVDDDPDLSAQAKIHLKNQYGLLKAASAHAETAAARQLIENDDELDDATKARLLSRLGGPAMDVVYSSTATVVEHPFPRTDVSSWAARTADEAAKAYAAALLVETGENVDAAEALNERLVDQGRIGDDLGREARSIFITHSAGSGKTAAFLAAFIEGARERFDLGLTQDDREFLASVGVAHSVASTPEATHVRKAARRSQSAGRAMRRGQDLEAELGQD